MKRSVFIASALVLGLAVPLAASAEFRSAGDDEVRFLARGPAGMKISGEASDLKASEKGGKLRIKVPVDDLKTGIGLRDKHLKKYIKSRKHKKAVLVVERSKLKLPGNDKTVKGSAKGEFTLAGVTKPLKFTYKAKRTGSELRIEARAVARCRSPISPPPCDLARKRPSRKGI